MKTLNMKAITFAFGLSMLTVFNVNAATQDAGTLSEIPVVTDFIQSPGAIADTLTFNLADLSDTYGDSKLWRVGPGFKITGGLVLDLYKVGSPTLIGSYGLGDDFTETLAAGDYYLSITGIANGSGGGAYSVALAAYAVPV
ncbi:MAG TPA: hypothetical protein VK974_04375, partial [Methylophilaceae bacterium]|nr:hypothetical protein [Methylophilaceae bacterium]